MFSKRRVRPFLFGIGKPSKNHLKKNSQGLKVYGQEEELFYVCLYLGRESSEKA